MGKVLGIRRMTLKEFRIYLRMQAQHYGSQKLFARHLGVNEAYLSDVIRGRRDPSEKLLLACGFRRTITYERISKE
jgi:transcriptional regulator with XRE-family HTH domain